MSKDQNNGLKSFGKHRFKLNHSSILVISALILILFVAFTVRIMPIRWEIPLGQTHLNEFDPYYQYSITSYMVDNGLFSPYTDHWVNYQQWYPQGLDMSMSLSALPMTAAALYKAVSFFGISVDLMTFCAVLTVALGTLSCLILYFIGKDMGGRAVGLFAALALALAPSFLQRSSLGFFDTEIPGLIGLLFFVLFFLRAMDSKRSLRGSLMYSIGAALALAYFITGWGAAYYVLNLVALFTFILVVLKRYDRRLLINYGVTMGLGLLIAIQLPYIGLSYLTSMPMIPVIAVFIILLINEFLKHNISTKTRLIITVAVAALIIISVIPLAYSGYLGEMAGKFTSVINPSTRATTPLIASVAEHRVTGWGNLYIELGIGAIFFLTGLYFVLKNPTNRNLFLLLFGITGLYFGASMVRLLVIFAPAFGLLMAMGIIGLLKPFMTMFKETPNAATKTKRKLLRVSREYSGLGVLMIFIILMTQFAFAPQTGGVPRAYAGAYAPTSISSAALPLLPNEPMPQWLHMLNYTSNSPHIKSTDVVAAWWDYGYWLSVMGNVTTLADNATINGTQIENVAFAYMANESQSLKMLSTYGQERVKYILAFTVLLVVPDKSGALVSRPWGYGDEGKWNWMADISGGAKDRLIKEGFMDSNNAWTNQTAFGNYYNGEWLWSEQGQDSVIYKLLADMEWQFADVVGGGLVIPLVSPVELDYLTFEYISGIDPANFNPSGDIVPLVGLYKIDWDAYNKDYPRR
jgi:dolichyl-diphosphooligosaccharide--protein glycosyltransferase